MREISPEMEKKLKELDNATYWDNNRRRSLKLALMREFKVCFWCGIEVKDYGDLTHKKSPPDLATVDHMVSKFFRSKGEGVLKVLACAACNTRRSAEECKIYGEEHAKKLQAKKLEHDRSKNTYSGALGWADSSPDSDVQEEATARGD